MIDNIFRVKIFKRKDYFTDIKLSPVFWKFGAMFQMKEQFATTEINQTNNWLETFYMEE